MTERSRVLLEGSDKILGVVRPNGTCDAEKFLQGLDNRYKARYQRWFEYYRDGRAIKNPENLRHLRQSEDVAVWELKSGGFRLYIVAHEDKWYVTHGVKKVQDKRVNAEIEKALGLFNELIR